MRLNRRAALVPFLALIMFIGGVVAIVYFNQKGIDASMDFGAPQREILETYADGEAARQYILLSAKYATHQALYSLSSNGGYESAGCEPDILPECKLALGGADVEKFVCAADSDEMSLCKRYNIEEFCTHYPCTFTVNNNLECVETEAGILCKISNDADAVLNSFECENLDSDKCADYGAELGRVVPLTMQMNCISQTFEKECELSACSGIGDYVYWANDLQTCTPDAAKLDTIFRLFFNDYFDNYLYKYDEIVIGDNLFTLYDAADYNLKIDLSRGVIEGQPARELIYTYKTDDDGNIIDLEETAKESVIEFKKTIEDEEIGVKPTVTFEYTVNPYFTYEMPYSPTAMFNSVKSGANAALAGIGACSGDIATRAATQQESLRADAVFDWKIAGETVDGACVVKFDVAPKDYTIYGVNPAGDVSVVDTAAPIRFAVKYSGNVVSV